MKRSFFPLFILLFVLSCSNQPEVSWDKFIDENMEFAKEQYIALDANLQDSLCPRTFENGVLQTSGTDWWCSGFFPGSLWYLYEYSNDDAMKQLARKRTMQLESEKYNTTTHDLGFMLYCSFGNAYRLTGNPEYAEILLQGAESLMTRYNDITGCIQSWDHGIWQFPVIIDNMMNLEFIFWAVENGGDKDFYPDLISHIDKTMENHFRPDFSSYHLVDYDTLTGDVVKRQTVQGWSDESSWARGQSWGLYGFVTVYRFTKDEKYLDFACHIADYLLNHPNLPEDMIPYWDYNAPDIPDAKRDASAGAIMASALIELSGYCDNERSESYLESAKTMLYSLGTKYRAEKGENGNFILKHSVGHYTADSEVDVPLTYADYYFIEGLMRLKSKL